MGVKLFDRKAFPVKDVPRIFANSTRAGSIIAKPTSVEYAFDAATGFLDVLEAVAEQIPLPGVATAVKIAKNIMQACDDSHATLERAEELKQRIKILVTILVDELKGKKGEEIQAELQKDIQALSNDLEYIYEKINDIASQNALLLIIFRSLNEDKVKKCVGRLEHSLENFTLVRQINDAKLLNSLEQEILAFHASYQKSLDSMKGKVDHIHATLDDVKAILEERRDLPATSTSRPRLRAAVPAKSSIFHGRDLLVDELVHILTSNSNSPKRPHICLLGPGGMGKTSTALAVMAHPDTSKMFLQENLIWVPCVKATSYSLFLDTLYSSLGTKQNTGDPRRDIIAEIKACKDAVVLLLDNFETPWNLIDSRAETEEMLNEIGQIPQATLFVTMRSSNPPGNDKQWRWFNLEAVDENAARRIYQDIYSAGSNDQELSALLETLGYMPLAITLMANTARMTRLGAGELMEEYKRIGTAMLGQGTDAKHSLDVCIKLSIESPPMKKHPEAYSLLETLAMMPVGTTYEALKDWWACDSPNLIGALQVLGETALVQRRDARYSVLPVIRSYLLDPSRFSSYVRSATIASACKFLTQHSSSPGDVSFKEHVSIISAEEENLQAILLGPVDPQPSLIEAMLVLVQHQLLTRPRLEVIEHAVGLARKIEGDQTLLADALSCYGKILHNFDRYDQAEEQFLLARQIFLSIPDKRQAARCSLNLIPLYTERDANGFEQKLELALEANLWEDSPEPASSSNPGGGIGWNERHSIAIFRAREDRVSYME
ncbi:hypothetical protein GALMADRAFT_157340 [Galerina marginata CBS 339.88]|uniref:Novel STAND NTPase 1 domain-containing protein n=1 Tax=Galerina marginata (strain CBS 339.88) TaxID=685588 RepID=A0A067T6V7_GALM3|nr:hypothetical protein GALMADRAFT_157340 [Galerina marginata CBS 339.88]